MLTYGFKYFYLIQIICSQFYGFKYLHLIQIIRTKLFGFKRSYPVVTICTQCYPAAVIVHHKRHMSIGAVSSDRWEYSLLSWGCLCKALSTGAPSCFESTLQWLLAALSLFSKNPVFITVSFISKWGISLMAFN